MAKRRKPVLRGKSPPPKKRPPSPAKQPRASARPKPASPAKAPPPAPRRKPRVAPRPKAEQPPPLDVKPSPRPTSPAPSMPPAIVDRPEPPAATPDRRSQASAARERAAARSRERFAAGAELGGLPKPANPKRREACRLDLLTFLVEYFPNSTGLSPFSDDHRAMIARLQACLLEGGRTINAVYRGFAKTTITERAALWATLYGHRKYVAIFSATRGTGSEIIDSVKMELETNEALAEDFPEVCLPVHALEGKAQRAASQTFNGELTHIEWLTDRIVLPTIPDSQASGAILVSKGLLSASRGTKHTRADGTVQRPDFVLLDDVQTDASAASPLQTGKRLATIKKSILKAAGHRVQLAAAVNATIIAPDDLVEQLLDPTRNPGWDGTRVPMVRQWSDAHETHWLGEYRRLRTTYDREIAGDVKRAQQASNDYYAAHRAEMDAGCVVSWESCYDASSELSAIQHAYNILIDDGEEVFASECQNAPLRNRAQDTAPLQARALAQRLSGSDRGRVPPACDRLTCFVDVHPEILYFVVAAYAADFGGAIIDYGTFPDQQRPRFAHTDLAHSLSALWPHMGEEARLLKALETLLDETLLPRVWERDDGAPLSIGRAGIDQGYQRDVVHQFCARSRHRALVVPTKGVGIGARHQAMNEEKPKPRETRGHNWKIPAPVAREVRHLTFDSNAWKSFAARRLTTAVGDPGALTLFGSPADPSAAARHELFCEHLTAEVPIATSGRGREVEEWTMLPGRDNHWLDGVVGCCVLASVQGCTLEGMAATSGRRQAKPIPEHMKKRS